MVPILVWLVRTKISSTTLNLGPVNIIHLLMLTLSIQPNRFFIPALFLVNNPLNKVLSFSLHI